MRGCAEVLRVSQQIFCWFGGRENAGLAGVGKTTVARAFAQQLGASYLTLDDTDVLSVAQADPPTFISASGTPLVIDEVQRVGQPLVLAIKSADTRPRSG